MTRLLRLALLVALAGGVLVIPGDALANHRCNTTIIVPGSLVILTHNQNCPAGTAMTIDADFVTLDLGGFAVSGHGTGDIGIDVTAGSDHVLITNGVVRGFDTGIRAGDCTVQIPPITDTDDFTIDSVSVRNSGTTGIELCPSEGDMLVRLTSVLGATTGIDTAGGVAGSGGTTAIDRVVVNDTSTGIRLAPIDFGQSYVQHSLVRDASAMGVSVSLGGCCSYAEVGDSTIRGCSGCHRGISASGQGELVVAQNTVRHWDIVGIETNNVSNVTIEDNVVRSIGGSGLFTGAILLFDQDFNTGALVASNIVRNVTGGPGIHLSCAQGVAVEDSVMSSIDGDGILVDDVPPSGLQCGPGVVSQADVLRHNLLLGMGGNGVAIVSGDGYTLSDNNVAASVLDGYFIGSAVAGCCGTEGAYLSDNIGRANGDDGFQLDTSSLELTSNLSRDNTGFGFETNFAGPVDVDNGQTALNNLAGNCSDPSDLPSTAC